MGCDIHCYVEYRKRGETGQDSWRDFGERINPGRNYRLFGFMAGVRSEGPAVVEPRGMPSDASYCSSSDNRIYIDYDGTSEEETHKPESKSIAFELLVAADLCDEKGFGEVAKLLRRKHFSGGYASPENAHRWVATGSSQYTMERDGKYRFVTHPDWHTHSWLTTAEFKEAISQAGNCGPEYAALLASMEHFETSGYESRLVFWFDN